MTRTSHPCTAGCGEIVELPAPASDAQRTALCSACRHVARDFPADLLVVSALAEARLGHFGTAAWFLMVAAAVAEPWHLLRTGGPR